MMFGKSWKTSLAGYLMAALSLVAGAYQAKQNNPAAPPVTVGTLAPAIGIAILGRLAKDYDATGGTR